MGLKVEGRAKYLLAGILILICNRVMLDICQGPAHGIWFHPHGNPMKSGWGRRYLFFTRSELRLGLRYCPELTWLESGRIHRRASGSTVSAPLRHSINILDKLSAWSWLSVVPGGVAASERESHSRYSHIAFSLGLGILSRYL